LLSSFQKAPGDVHGQEILTAELTEIISQDREFAVELERLVNEVWATGAAQIASTEFGAIAAGNMVQRAGQDLVGRDKVGGDQVGRDKISYAPAPPPER
jgi:hypothetical protein